MGNAISTDTTNCEAVWLFNNDVIDRMTGQVTMTKVVSTSISFDTLNMKEGTHSIKFLNYPTKTAYLTHLDAGLPSGFPAKSGQACASWTFVGWFKLINTNSLTNQTGIICKWDTVGSGRSFIISVASGTHYLRFGIGINAGAGAQIIDIASAAVVAGRWYHFACKYELNTFSMVSTLYDAVLGTQIGSARMSPSSGMSSTTAAFTIGCLNGGAVSAEKRCMDGWIDELAIFKGLLDDTSIASIRAGTFNAIVTAAPPAGGSNLFSADATCLVALRFENNINDDSQYGHTFSGVKTPAFSAHATVGTPEGTYCFAKEYGVTSGYFTIDCSSLGTKYPWFTGSVISAMTMCCYVRVDTALNGGFRVWAEAGNPSALYSWRLEYYTNGGIGNFNVLTTGPTETSTVRYSGSGSGTHEGKWNHVFLQINNATSKYILRVYELTSGTTVSRACGSLTNSMARGGGRIMIGRRAVTAENDISMAGAIDEFVLFNRAITTAEVDQIRAGTFLYTAAPPAGGGANLIFGLSLALGRKLQT